MQKPDQTLGPGGRICHLSHVTPWGGVVVPPQGSAPRGGAAAPLRPPLGPLSLRSGGRSLGPWPLAALGASAVCARWARLRGLRPALPVPFNPGPGRLPRPGWLAALAPGAAGFAPLRAASPLAPARARAPVARGPVAPPGSPLRGLGGRRRAPGRGLAAPPPRGWRSARASLWFGLAALALPPLRPPSRALAAPRGPPSGPAAARRLRAARLPSLLPPWGPPRGGGAQRSRALLATSPRGGLPPAWLRPFGLRCLSVRAPAGAGLAAAPLGYKVPPR